MPGSRSAGRVQSVAVRLIYEREIEIEQFEPENFIKLESKEKLNLLILKPQFHHLKEKK